MTVTQPGAVLHGPEPERAKQTDTAAGRHKPQDGTSRRAVANRKRNQATRLLAACWKGA